MGIKRLRWDKSTRVQTAAGLDVRLFNESLEIELARTPFGVNIELVNAARSSSGDIAPRGAYYRISFYESGTVTGESGRETPIKTLLPGAVYLSRDGVLIRGCTPVPSGTKEAFIDYRDR